MPCSSITALSGNTSPHIPGRYTASCPDLRYGNPSNAHCDQFTGVSGLHSESEKVHFITFTEPRVSGILNRHNHNVTVTATRQGAEDQEGMPSLHSHVKDNPKTTSSPNWFNDLNITSSPPSYSPSTLQNATDAAFPSSVESPELRYSHSLDSGSPSRFRMVGRPDVKLQQSTDYAQASGSTPGVRCFKEWLGGILQNHTGKDQRTVEPPRPESSYQCSGTPGSFPYHSIIFENQKEYSCANISGQHSGSKIHQSYGKHTLSSPVSSCDRAVGVVLRSANHSPCRTPAWEPQLQGRFRVEASQRLQRLETTSSGIQCIESTVWSLFNRFIYFLSEHTSGALLQVETRLSSSRGECPVTTMEQATSICLSPICPNRQMSPESPRREVRSSPPDSPSLASTELVPSSGNVSGNSKSSSPTIRHSPESSKELHPLVVQNHLTLAAWPVSGISSRQMVFQKTLKEYTVPPGEEEQQNLMNQHGENGSAGVVQGKLILFKPLFTTSQST